MLEVGLGGRFDATNVIARPAVSVIMPISLDHEAYLGDRVELIAVEKAGIIKRGAPVVIGAQEHDAARDVLVDTAERLSCPVLVYGQDFIAYEENGRMIYQDEGGLLDLTPPRLAGRHQFANAATAIAAVKAAGFDGSLRVADRAMKKVEWAGRMQKLTDGHLVELAPAGAEIWLDGGHNPGAGTVIAEAMAEQEETAAAALPDRLHDQHQGPVGLFWRVPRHGAARLHRTGGAFGCGRPERRTRRPRHGGGAVGRAGIVGGKRAQASGRDLERA